MDEQKQDDQLKPTVPIGDVSLKIWRKAMDDREGWKERVRDTHADGATG